MPFSVIICVTYSASCLLDWISSTISGTTVDTISLSSTIGKSEKSIAVIKSVKDSNRFSYSSTKIVPSLSKQLFGIYNDLPSIFVSIITLLITLLIAVESFKSSIIDVFPTAAVNISAIFFTLNLIFWSSYTSKLLFKNLVNDFMNLATSPCPLFPNQEILANEISFKVSFLFKASSIKSDIHPFKLDLSSAENILNFNISSVKSFTCSHWLIITSFTSLTSL